MSDLKLSLSPDPKPDPNAAVTPIDRHELIRKLQTAALARPDPLAANLGVLLGDMLRLAHATTDRPHQAMAAQGPGVVRRETDSYLKVVREVERVARLDMELADGQDD